MEISRMLKGRAIRYILNTSLLLAFFIPLCLILIFTLAIGDTEKALPTFREFSKPVQNGQSDTLRGVYVSNVLALPVAQQPADNANYVSEHDGEATQFLPASQHDNVGLLAHNHLAGKSFSKLAVGQEVRLVYGDGNIEYFVVTEVLRYQALQPKDPWSSFRSLDNDEVLTAEQLFNRVYLGDHHVTFQTCIAANGVLSWGRLFVLAVPKHADFRHLIIQSLQ
jgi:hypothetical protein